MLLVYGLYQIIRTGVWKQNIKIQNDNHNRRLAAQSDSLRTEIDNLASDSGYKGINLLASDNLVVDFNENGSNQLTVSGFDASSGGLGINAVITAGPTTTTTNNNPAPDSTFTITGAFPNPPDIRSSYASGQSFFSPTAFTPAQDTALWASC